ncbi:CYTH domain-containing protein [Tsukamurella ocularis]|uniref:hypothetical protein n=1 Tax=Tsukamurella ocularis TaxID=1970234 RepID=UPI0039EDF429
MDKPHYERERRFIVEDKSIIRQAPWEYIEQGYVWAIDGYAIRARVIQDPVRDAGEHSLVDRQGVVTAKGPRIGDEREEYEVNTTVAFAREIVSRSDFVIRKRRYHVIDPETEQTWDIDEFLDENEGLLIAELEAGKGPDEDDLNALRELPVPKWAYREVTSDKRFNNENLADTPVSRWENPEDWKPSSPWDW